MSAGVAPSPSIAEWGRRDQVNEQKTSETTSQDDRNREREAGEICFMGCLPP